MESKIIRTDLLRELARHLLTGKLGHKRFDFSTFNNVDNVCGTSGCAAGECPIIWPEEWMFSTNRKIRLKVSNHNSYPPNLTHDDCFADLADFFCITAPMVYHLFIPSEYDEDIEEFDLEGANQQPELFGGDYLGGDATKQEVANNILIFCDMVEKGVINAI